MIWLTNFSFLLVVILAQSPYAESKKNNASPWADKGKAKNFMNCFIYKVQTSTEISQQEKEDIESVVQTMSDAINNMKAHGGSIKTQMNAFNSAFASSIAETIISDENNQDVSRKTQIYVQILSQCFQSVMGSVNQKFLREIQDLIKVFAEEAAENNAQNYIPSDNTIQQSTVPLQNTQTTPFGQQPSTLFPNTLAPGLPAAGSPGTALSSSTLSTIVTKMVKVLSSSTTIQTIVQSGYSNSVIANIFIYAMKSTLSTAITIDSSTVSSIITNMQSSLTNIGANASANAYLQVVISSLITGLSSKGILNSSNAISLTVNLSSSLLQASSSIATQLGINISASAVQSDINIVTKNLQSTSTTSSVGKISQVSGPGPYPKTVVPATGSTGAGPSSTTISAYLSVVVQLVSSSQTWQYILQKSTNYQVTVQILVSATQSCLTSLNISSDTVSSITSSMQTALFGLGDNGSDQLYCRAVFTVILNTLFSSGFMTSDNASSIIVLLCQTYIQSIVQVSVGFGFYVSADIVQADLTNISKGLQSTNLPTTAISSDQSDVSTITNTLQSFSTTSTVGSSSFDSVLSSPNGLTSADASSRIQSVSNTFYNDIKSNGLSFNILGNLLTTLNGNIVRSSGMSATDSKIETLMEALVVMYGMLNSAVGFDEYDGSVSPIAASQLAAVMSNLAN